MRLFFCNIKKKKTFLNIKIEYGKEKTKRYLGNYFEESVKLSKFKIIKYTDHY